MIFQDWTLCLSTVIKLLHLVKVRSFRASDMVRCVHRSAQDLKITIELETAAVSS
jgi:hypothetical protein